MSEHSPIATLITLADKEAEQLAQHLGIALKAHQEQEQKLALLLQYRDDYAKRYQQNMVNGLGIACHQNFRDFLNRLDEAIAGQQGLVEHALHSVNCERNAWQTAEKKRLSFNTLAQRAQHQLQQQTLRSEQKSTDEYATRMAQHRALRAQPPIDPDS